jgi:PAS domain-containing protein
MVPIVFYTSHAEKEMVERAKRITNYGYVLKNAGEFVLIESINMAYQLFESHRATVEREEELNALYEHTPVMMVLLDKHKTIRKANGYVAEFTATRAEKLMGKRPGEAMRCIHHLRSPEGCGYGAFCEKCTIRKTVEDTFVHGRDYHQIEADLPMETTGDIELITLLV